MEAPTRCVLGTRGTGVSWLTSWTPHWMIDFCELIWLHGAYDDNLLLWMVEGGTHMLSWLGFGLNDSRMDGKDEGMEGRMACKAVGCRADDGGCFALCWMVGWSR